MANKEQKLVPVNSVKLDGETIKKVIYMEVAGGWKMFIVFESEKVLILPVYPECPVQVGKLSEMKKDIVEMIRALNIQRQKTASYADRTINDLRSL